MIDLIGFTQTEIKELNLVILTEEETQRQITKAIKRRRLSAGGVNPLPEDSAAGGCPCTIQLDNNCVG